jgi:PGF-pre-PGF domain-containing protein
MRSIKQFIALMFCLFVGTSILLVAGISAADENYYYSDKGNNLANYMYMDLDLVGLQDNDIVFLSFSTKYDIEETGDFAMPFITYDPNHKHGIGENEWILNGTQTDWTIESCDLSSFVNESFFSIGFYYQTDDSGTIRDGFYVDDIEITVNGETIFTDDGTNESWTLVGFTRVSETGDTTAPVIDQPLDIWIEQNATGDITWIVTETNPGKYWVLRDGLEVVSPKSYENGEEIKVLINTSAKGTYDYTIYANDTSDNNASDQVEITVNDTLLPTIDITSPASGYSTDSESVTISGVVDGTGSVPTVTVNEKPATFTPTGVYSGTFSVSVSLSLIGDNPIKATVTDAAGMKEYDEITVNRYKKSSSGGGGGGGGTSGEDFGNILVSETEREYVNKDSKVSYSFDTEGNIIRYINFTGKTSSGRISAKIDILKDTSTLVDQAPPGKVFKNMGIYVGNLGWSNPNNIADPTISFYVDKSWVTEYNIDISTIRLNRYSDGKWNPLETDLSEDQDFLHFESKTPGFSQFAVTGTEVSAAQESVEDVVVKPTIVVEMKEPVTEQTPEEKDTGIPGFTLLTGIIIMLVVVKLLRR